MRNWRTRVLILCGAALVIAVVPVAVAQAAAHATASRPKSPARGGHSGATATWHEATPAAPGTTSAAASSASAEPTGQQSSTRSAEEGIAAAGQTPAVTGTTGALHKLGTQGVALTFDDGPGPDTPRILALLREYEIKATFCVIGSKVRQYPDMVRQIVQDGHSLCNHTWSHDLSLGTKSAEAIRADLQRTNDQIHSAAPDAQIRYFRHPGGNFTARSVQVAGQLGMTSIAWDVDPKDWDTKRYGTGQPMAAHVVSVVKSQVRPGSIVLSHDGGGDRSGTVAAYQTLLPWLQAQYELVASLT